MRVFDTLTGSNHSSVAEASGVRVDEQHSCDEVLRRAARGRPLVPGLKHESRHRMARVDCEACVTRLQPVRLPSSTVCASRVGPERANAVDNGEQARDDPLEILVFNARRIEAQVTANDLEY